MDQWINRYIQKLQIYIFNVPDFLLRPDKTEALQKGWKRFLEYGSWSCLRSPASITVKPPKLRSDACGFACLNRWFIWLNLPSPTMPFSSMMTALVSLKLSCKSLRGIPSSCTRSPQPFLTGILRREWIVCPSGNCDPADPVGATILTKFLWPANFLGML